MSANGKRRLPFTNGESGHPPTSRKKYDHNHSQNQIQKESVTSSKPKKVRQTTPSPSLSLPQKRCTFSEHQPQPSTSRQAYERSKNCNKSKRIEEENWEENLTVPKEENTQIDFFGFSTQKDIVPPNVIKAEVKTEPRIKTEHTGYRNLAPEQEREYGTRSIQPIPMHCKKSNSDTEDDEEDSEKKVEGSNGKPTKTRYFMTQSVYEKYDFNGRKVDGRSFAVYEQRKQILDVLDRSRVVIIEGFTGCGKTTQVPQYILDRCKWDKKYCNIVVTQPRKIAAISVARRVCYERYWNLGTIVGYQVGMDSSVDKNETLLKFVTTGVLLQQLISNKSLKDYTHIIIDEVHERDLETDMLLLLIRRIMAMDTKGKEQNVKLILMSATIKTEVFEKYFSFKTPTGQILKPTVIKIPTACRYKVEERYLDDILKSKGEVELLRKIDQNLNLEEAKIQDEIFDQVVGHIIDLDKYEKAKIRDPRVRNKDGYLKERGSVLVFLPGMEEIRRMERCLSIANDKSKNSYLWNIISLHSSISAEDQSKVFDASKGGIRKIILSTNIAESSVTVPDVAYVYDFCLTKTNWIDKTTNFTTLKLVWASKSQCVQRKGRAGRVANGKCFRLVPKTFYDQLAGEIVPEIRRSSLENTILNCKKFGYDSPKNLLSESLDKPDLSKIQRAIATLKELGALTIEMKDKKSSTGFRYDPCDGDLTFVGQIMSDLPIPLQCTRLILLGQCFGVMDEAVIIAAGVSVGSPYQTSAKMQLDSYLKKMDHAKNTFSDLFALYYVYKKWELNYSGGHKKVNRERLFAKEANINLATLRDIKRTITVVEERLKRNGVKQFYSLPGNPSNPEELTGNQGLFLKLAIAGAFYPHYFLRRRPEPRENEKKIQKALHGHDAFRTVYFTGFPKESQHGKLYAKHVADYLTHGRNVPAIDIQNQKVLAIFDNSTGDKLGPFNRAIFRAIKRRQLRNDCLEFNMLPPVKEKEMVDRWNAKVSQRKRCPELTKLPSVTVQQDIVKMQHIVSPSQFWVILSQDFHRHLNFFNVLQNTSRFEPLHPSKIYPNSFCLAPYNGDYYRAKIVTAEYIEKNISKVLVYFVDYGNSERVFPSDLRDFSPEMMRLGMHKAPCMAVECRLKELKPNIMHGLQWNAESIQLMQKFAQRAKFLEIEIFSVYNSVIIGELFGYTEQRKDAMSLNELLTIKCEDVNQNKLYGEHSPEPYLSVDNHNKRKNVGLMRRDEIKAVDLEQIGIPFDLDFMDPPKDAKIPCRLRGPDSPLEMSFEALVHCSNTKAVQVETSSVNSVLLDHEPTSPNSRMLVAAQVRVIEKNKSVMVQESTIMPTIPGILPLVCLMFAPKVELRVNELMSKYTGMLCGCGTVPGRPMEAVHPDNDMEIAFDVVIDNDDMTDINIIRNRLSSMLRTGAEVNKTGYHSSLRNLILKLFLRKRKNIDREVWLQEEYVWNRISSSELEPIQSGLSFNHEDIFRPFNKVKLNKELEEDLTWDAPY